MREMTKHNVKNEKFVEKHGGRIGDIAVYGQESNSTTRQRAMMDLAIRGIGGDLGPEYADTFRRDLHKDRKADDVLANPSFYESDWHRSDEDVRWQYDRLSKGERERRLGAAPHPPLTAERLRRLSVDVWRQPHLGSRQLMLGCCADFRILGRDQRWRFHKVRCKVPQTHAKAAQAINSGFELVQRCRRT